MDNPIASEKVKHVVANMVLPMCGFIQEKHQIQKDIEGLESQLKKKRTILTEAEKKESDNFNAFMELLELTSFHSELARTPPTTMNRFAFMMGCSRETTQLSEFYTLFRMINDRLHPKDQMEAEDGGVVASSEGSTEPT